MDPRTKDGEQRVKDRGQDREAREEDVWAEDCKHRLRIKTRGHKIKDREGGEKRKEDREQRTEDREDMGHRI